MLYIAFEFSFIVMKMIWCRGPSRSKMQFFRAKITVIAGANFELASLKEERR